MMNTRNLHSVNSIVSFLLSPCHPHTHRYYFSVANTVAGQVVRFNIINMSKHESLYAQGMRTLVFSDYAAAHCGEGWRRAGERIKYVPTNPKLYARLNSGQEFVSEVKDPKGGHALYTLSFTMKFETSNDVCYLAYCYPYTYSDLQRHLDLVQHKSYVRRSLLCRSLAGNACDVLTITSPSSEAAAILARPGIVITARVHPGESNASYVMKGIINFLTSSHPKAKVSTVQTCVFGITATQLFPMFSLSTQALRDGFVIKIVPMLNPDGVINGNYRTSLAGDDLNRRWGNPDPILHPTIWWTKKLVEVSRDPYFINEEQQSFWIK